MNSVIHIDVETFSSVDLKKCGAHKYTLSPDFEVMLCAFAFNDGPVTIVDLTTLQGRAHFDNTVVPLLLSPENTLVAYNAQFEILALWPYVQTYLAFDTWVKKFRCVMLAGMFCGYPRGLGAIGEAMGLPQDKRKLGQGLALIRTFCVPHKPTKTDQRERILPEHEPEKWELFKRYCAQDVVAERDIEGRLSAWPMPEDEIALWHQDLLSNARGVRVDPALVRGALRISETTTEELMAEATALTGISNPKSIPQLKGWLEDETDETVESLNKQTVTDMIATETDPKVRRVLEIRQELGKASVAKFAALDRSMCADERVRGLLMFYGASRTGRWGGSNFQPQNLPGTQLKELDLARQDALTGNADWMRLLYGPNVPSTLSKLIRTALLPSEGRKLIVADFSAIEARVIAWLAGEQWVMDVFASHGKIYEATAAQMFGVPIDTIAKGQENYALRQRGKVAVLALGYGGGAGALIAMGAVRNGIPEDELEDIKYRWRSANPRITELWRRVERCAIEAVRTGAPQGTNGVLFALEADQRTGQSFLTVTLPSRRKLFYVRPFVAPGKYGDALYYWGTAINEGQKSKKWQTISTWGGKLVENLCQAIARDCLAETLRRCYRAGYDVLFTVHDEVVIDALPGAEVEAVLSIMREPIDWAPGLILNAAGFETPYYIKD